MKYNLYIKTFSETYNILDINEKELSRIIEVYKFGKKSVFIQGKKYGFEKLMEIQIFTFDHPHIKSAEEIMKVCRDQDLFGRGYLGWNEWVPEKVLNNLGKRITEDHINDDFGYLKDIRLEGAAPDNFVDPERIDEIQTIKNKKFDFTKLTALLKELNVAYANGLFLSIPLLVRAITDHIPPVFSKSDFNDLSGSYGTRSFKDSMINLNKSSRKIADSFLHTQIRAKESLPNQTQINFKHDLDVLLQEIVRVNKI